MLSTKLENIKTKEDETFTKFYTKLNDSESFLEFGKKNSWV